MSGSDESGFEPSGVDGQPRRWQLRPLSEATPRHVRWLLPGLIPLRFSPRCKLVRDPLNLARNIAEFERIVGLHGCERRRLAPPAIKQFSNRGHSVTVMGFRILGDLQQDTGKTYGRPAALFAHCFCESLGASSWVA